VQFPVIHRLVGDDSFRAMARRFIASEPPHSPSPMHYGESFPRFLQSLEKTASTVAPIWPCSARPTSL
jgi:hypothetical protein